MDDPAERNLADNKKRTIDDTTTNSAKLDARDDLEVGAGEEVSRKHSKKEKKKEKKHKKEKKRKKEKRKERKKSSSSSSSHRKRGRKDDEDSGESSSNSSSSDDDDDDAPRSIITGKKIKMSREITLQDRMLEIERAAKRHFMNTQYS